MWEKIELRVSYIAAEVLTNQFSLLTSEKFLVFPKYMVGCYRLILSQLERLSLL